MCRKGRSVLPGSSRGRGTDRATCSRRAWGNAQGQTQRWQQPVSPFLGHPLSFLLPAAKVEACTGPTSQDLNDRIHAVKEKLFRHLLKW